MDQREQDLLQLSWCGSSQLVNALVLRDQLVNKTDLELKFQLVVPERWRDLVDLQTAHGMPVIYAPGLPGPVLVVQFDA